MANTLRPLKGSRVWAAMFMVGSTINAAAVGINIRSEAWGLVIFNSIAIVVCVAALMWEVAHLDD